MPLDDQVDAQPLVVPCSKAGILNCPANHDAVYVATANNSLYAIDGQTGTIILGPVNLGPPVPNPLGCHSNAPNVGIHSTPTIDLNTNTLYLLAYVNVNGTTPTYFVHALHLASTGQG